MFYAEKIAGGANTGIATSGSLDVVAVTTQGNSATPQSGTAVTTVNGDLLLGAITTGNPETFTAGSGYLIEARCRRNRGRS
jgi:hypothetical protein